MKLSQWAKKNSVTYRTAFTHFKKGMIDGGYTLKSGAIMVKDETPIKLEHNVVYARVSSVENKNNLETQASRIIQFCNAKGWGVHEVIKECASGLNDTRPKLINLLKEQKATRIIVEHKDRLTRFGFNYIKTLYPNCEFVIINNIENDQEDLVQDFVNLVTSFCARLYGKRRSKRATEKLIKELND